MSTRSRIGIKNADGSIDSVWQHWDGYPSHTGAHLLADHNTEEKARALVNEGDRDCIEKAYTRDDFQTDADFEASHKPRHDRSENEFWERFGDECEEYAYIWTEKGWICHGHGTTAPLEAIAEAQAGLRDLQADRAKENEK